jgi:hypothetical protein
VRIVLGEVSGDVGQHELQDVAAEGFLLHNVEVALEQANDLVGADGLGRVEGGHVVRGGESHSLFEAAAGDGSGVGFDSPPQGGDHVAVAGFVGEARKRPAGPPPERRVQRVGGRGLGGEGAVGRGQQSQAQVDDFFLSLGELKPAGADVLVEDEQAARFEGAADLAEDVLQRGKVVQGAVRPHGIESAGGQGEGVDVGGVKGYSADAPGLGEGGGGGNGFGRDVVSIALLKGPNLRQSAFEVPDAAAERQGAGHGQAAGKVFVQRVRFPIVLRLAGDAAVDLPVDFGAGIPPVQTAGGGGRVGGGLH